MSFFSQLFDVIPDADILLSLEPQQLAGPLLVSLEDNEWIKPNEVISHASMEYAIQGDLKQKYPYNCRDKVLYALMEAWQWLEREGFVTPMPTSLVGISTTAEYGTQYFISKRGEKIQTSEDLDTYSKANLLPKEQLHPIIAQKVWSVFLQGDYDAAVLLVFKQVEIAVRKAGNYAEADIGVPLMRKAFHVGNGNLTDPSRQTAEKQARSDLFAGAIGSLKNPGSHREVEITAEEAAEVIIFASHLLRIVDSCNQSEGN